MRYLFGDSTPFPHAFDFLRTLEAFMNAGTHVVLLEHGARKVADEAFAARQERMKGFETLERFHLGVLRSLATPAVPAHPFTTEYAARLIERAKGLVAERQRGVQEADERDDAGARAERERANGEIAGHLRTFFLGARLPTLATRRSAALVDGRLDARVSLVHPSGIGVSFTLDTSKAQGWSAPRRLSDLAGHLELVVGIKKSWIGGKISREPVRLDDWVLGSAELTDESATIAVRKKPDQKDSLVFRLGRGNEGLTAAVDHPGDPNAAMVPSAAEAADLPHLDRLWSAIGATFDAIIEERSTITGISLDGEDVIELALGHKLVERLVTVLAPTALEVARRSPNARELSLKREGEGGRREELYLRRDQLLEALQPLPREGRAVFAPLGLDDWVPAASMRPPEVRAAKLPTAPARDEAKIPGRSPPSEARDELTSLDFEDG